MNGEKNSVICMYIFVWFHFLQIYNLYILFIKFKLIFITIYLKNLNYSCKINIYKYIYIFIYSFSESQMFHRERDHIINLKATADRHELHGRESECKRCTVMLIKQMNNPCVLKHFWMRKDWNDLCDILFVYLSSCRKIILWGLNNRSEHSLYKIIGIMKRFDEMINDKKFDEYDECLRIKKREKYLFSELLLKYNKRLTQCADINLCYDPKRKQLKFDERCYLEHQYLFKKHKKNGLNNYTINKNMIEKLRKKNESIQTKRCKICLLYRPCKIKQKNKIIKRNKYCSQCKQTYYCSKKHQLMDWKDQHKQICYKL